MTHMKHKLKGRLVNSHLITGKKNDKFLILSSTGNLTLEDVIDRMLEEGTGLRRETLEHAVRLYHRMLTELVLNGYSVNTGLFRVVAQPRGVIEGEHWDPERNSIEVTFVQDKEIREAIAETAVEILGRIGKTMYIINGENTFTHAGDGAATPGCAYMLRGHMIKVVGDHESVGITLTDADGRVIRITRDRLALNYPKSLLIQLPEDLAEGEYTLTVTTQFCNTGRLLKTPRSADINITVRTSNTPGG